MRKIVTFGELLLRLKAPGKERLFQSPMLEVSFGGGEANVAVSLSILGMSAAFVGALSRDAIGEAGCARFGRTASTSLASTGAHEERAFISSRPAPISAPPRSSTIGPEAPLRR